MASVLDVSKRDNSRYAWPARSRPFLALGRWRLGPPSTSHGGCLAVCGSDQGNDPVLFPLVQILDV